MELFAITSANKVFVDSRQKDPWNRFRWIFKIFKFKSKISLHNFLFFFCKTQHNADFSLDTYRTETIFFKNQIKWTKMMLKIINVWFVNVTIYIMTSVYTEKQFPVERFVFIVRMFNIWLPLLHCGRNCFAYTLYAQLFSIHISHRVRVILENERTCVWVSLSLTLFLMCWREHVNK